MNLLRASTGLGVVVLLSALAIPSAFAHAAYESSDPANGASVSSPPSRVMVEFTEPVVDESRLEVYDPCGGQVDQGDSLVAADRITISMSADKQGTYTVTFSVISAVDSHPTNGEFTFTSTGGDPCPGEEPPPEESGGGAGSEGSSGGSGAGSGNPQSATGSGGAAQTSQTQQDDRVERRDPRSPSDVPRRERERASERSQAQQDMKMASRQNEDPSDDLGPAALSTDDLPNVWDTIPAGAFLVAMLLAAVMGGAGGLIYAGIMGYSVSSSSRLGRVGNKMLSSARAKGQM